MEYNFDETLVYIINLQCDMDAFYAHKRTILLNMKYEIVAQNFDRIIQKYRNILLRGDIHE